MKSLCALDSFIGGRRRVRIQCVGAGRGSGASEKSEKMDLPKKKQTTGMLKKQDFQEYSKRLAKIVFKNR